MDSLGRPRCAWVGRVVCTDLGLTITVSIWVSSVEHSWDTFTASVTHIAMSSKLSKCPLESLGVIADCACLHHLYAVFSVAFLHLYRPLLFHSAVLS